MNRSPIHWATFLATLMALGLGALALQSEAHADFTYNPPGELLSGSGQGRGDNTVYVPNMRFPLEQTPAFANSQVWGRGGMHGGSGGQCHAENYSYPWWDNYCESRSWDMPLCPSGTGHQGQDIRPATCEDNVHWAVAAEAGQITNIGSYSVNLTADSGTQHRYLHMEPTSVTVNVGDRVTKGQQLGRVSNAFGGASTTIHLHYDLRQNVSGHGTIFVPTYMSLVRSYEALLGTPAAPCGIVPPGGGIIDDASPCFMLLGNIGTWRTVQSGGHEGSYRWTYAYDGDAPDGYARWQIETEQAGNYRVEAHVVAEFGKSRRARYGVRHSGQVVEVRLDQAASAGWRELGEFAFAAGADQWVEIYDNTGEPFSERLEFVADAVRLTRLDPDPQPDPDPDPQPDPDAGLGPDTGIDYDRLPNTPDHTASSSTTGTSSCQVASAQGTGAAGIMLGLWVLMTLGWRRRSRVV